MECGAVFAGGGEDDGDPATATAARLVMAVGGAPSVALAPEPANAAATTTAPRPTASRFRTLAPRMLNST